VLDKRIEQLEKQLHEIDALQGETISSPAFVRWREATKRRIERIFGKESEHLDMFNSISYDSPFVGVSDRHKQQQRDRRAFVDGIEAARNRLLVMIDELRESMELAELQTHHDSLPVDTLEPSSDPIRVLERFRECCHHLKDLPSEERDVQDILWIMLRSHYDDLAREETLPRFGIKNYRPDFGLPDSRLLVEVKFVGPKTQVSRIQEEILADVPGYLNSATNYDAVIVFVYDAVHLLRDCRKFIEDLKSVEGIAGVLVEPGLG